MQYIFNRYILLVYFGRNAFASQLRVDGKGKVEHGSPFGQFDQFAGRSEDIYLVFVEIHLEILHQIQRIVLLFFQGGTYGVEELIQAAFLFHTFVFPMGGKTLFGNVVHSFTTNLDFNPLPVVTHKGDVQGLVAVGFGMAHPVAQAVGVGLVYLGYGDVNVEAVV